MPLHTSWPQNPFPHNTSLKWPNCLSEVFIPCLLLPPFLSSFWTLSHHPPIAPNSSPPFPPLHYNCSSTPFQTRPLPSSLFSSPSSRHLVEFIVLPAVMQEAKRCLFKSMTFDLRALTPWFRYQFIRSNCACRFIYIYWCSWWFSIRF